VPPPFNRGKSRGVYRGSKGDAKKTCGGGGVVVYGGGEVVRTSCEKKTGGGGKKCRAYNLRSKIRQPSSPMDPKSLKFFWLTVTDLEDRAEQVAGCHWLPRIRRQYCLN